MVQLLSRLPFESRRPRTLATRLFTDLEPRVTRIVLPNGA